MQGGQHENPFGDDASTTLKKIFQLLNQTIETLGGAPAPELALPLYLQCAEDSRAQITTLHLIIGTFNGCTSLLLRTGILLTHKATEVHVYLVIDHSVQVDVARSEDAVQASCFASDPVLPN